MSGQYNDALSAYLEALDDLREYRRYSESSSIEEETLVRGPILLGQGQTYVRMGKLQEASAALAESARANADDPFFLAQTQNALGKLAIETGNYEEAARRFDRAASLFEKPGNVYYQAALQVNRAELEYRLGKLAAVRRWAKEVVHRTADDNIKVHRIRAHVWLAIADTTEWTADDPTAEFFMALRMAVADLDNIYLCREILKQYQDQIAKLKSRLDSEKHRELSKHIDNGLDSIRTHNRSVQAMLDEWHKEVRGLCGDGT
jgi:tetratricopeptide (TPR) repeat protein